MFGRLFSTALALGVLLGGSSPAFTEEARRVDRHITIQVSYGKVLCH